MSKDEFEEEDYSPEEEAETSEDEEDFEEFDRKFRQMLEESNQKKQNRKFKIKLSIAASAGIILLILLFCFTDFGIIGAYKKNFAKNFERLFPPAPEAIDIGATERDSNVQEFVDSGKEPRVKNVEHTANNVKVISFDGAASGKFEAYQGGLICAATNKLTYILRTGETAWEKRTTVVDPLLSVDGMYIAVAAENGTKLCLYRGEELVFERTAEDKIQGVRVSANGDVVLVCDKKNYKGAISVYNKDGQEIFAWSSGQNNVISADISSATRRVAATLLNADRKVYSVIKVFDINSKTNSVDVVFDDTILYKVDYTGDTITGFGDNSLVCMTSTGRIICDKRFDMVDILHYAFDSEGNKLIHFDSAGMPVFHVYGRKGVLKSEIIVDASADCIDVDGDMILYNNNRNIILQKAGSDRLNEYTATMDVLKLVLMNKSAYAVIHSNSIEVVGV